MSDYICAIDIGSMLTRVLTARYQPDDLIEILGVGVAPSRGVRGGAIVNIEHVMQSLDEAVREAELISGLVVEEALVGMSARHLQGNNSRGVVAIANRDRIVREGDVLRVIEGARNMRLPSDHEIIHVLSREFRVDDQNEIRDPVGMSGVRLEAEVHIVSAQSQALSNLEKVVSGAGIKVTNVVMNSLASAEAVLSPGEKDLGVAVVDLGAGGCDIIVYRDGGVVYSGFVPLGGSHVTHDLSVGLKIPVDSAEVMKKTYGLALAAMADPTEHVELVTLPGRPARQILRQEMAEIIEARLKEIFEMIDMELYRADCKQFLSGGIILTGGGALIEGSEELASMVTGVNVARGAPTGLSGFSERTSGLEFATITGLIRYAERVARTEIKSGGQELNGRERQNGLVGRLRGWISENL